MLLAVHLSDGVLTWPWLAGGFLLAALLVAMAFPLRDEDIPRTALLTAVFFVASLLHVKCGPSSVHLLLNGLVGILLGRRAGLAIGLGLLLQVALLGHGGFTTLGINTVVMTLPALLVGGLFTLLHQADWIRRPWFRALLIAVGVFCWCETLVLAITVLVTNPLTALVQANIGPGLHVNVPDFAQAWAAVMHPVTLILTAIVAAAAAWGERRLGNVPEFPLGFLLGMLAVLLTITLNALVLLGGGVEDWHTIVNFLFLLHLPLAALEGVILGFVVGFLARVKPEMLRLPVARTAQGIPRLAGQAPVATATAPQLSLKPPGLMLLAIVTLVGLATPVFAHQLSAGYKVLPGQRVVVDSWFPSGERPLKATVQVLRPDGSVLAEGPLDLAKGFTFGYERQEMLRIVVNAPGGHRVEVSVQAAELPVKDGPGPDAGVKENPKERGGEQETVEGRIVTLMGKPASLTDGSAGVDQVQKTSSVSYKDVISGLALVLGLGGFVLGVRNHQHLVALRRLLVEDGRLIAEKDKRRI